MKPKSKTSVLIRHGQAGRERGDKHRRGGAGRPRRQRLEHTRGSPEAGRGKEPIFPWSLQSECGPNNAGISDVWLQNCDRIHFSSYASKFAVICHELGNEHLGNEHIRPRLGRRGSQSLEGPPYSFLGWTKTAAVTHPFFPRWKWSEN